MKPLLIKIIQLYQSTLSPDHGLFRARWPHGFCKFYPSCSQYGLEALRHHNIPKAAWLTAKRLLKCNPFSQPGFDPVPKPKF